MNARKREPLTDFSRIDRRYDLIVTKKNVDLVAKNKNVLFEFTISSLKCVYILFDRDAALIPVPQKSRTNRAGWSRCPSSFWPGECTQQGVALCIGCGLAYVCWVDVVLWSTMTHNTVREVSSHVKRGRVRRTGPTYMTSSKYVDLVALFTRGYTSLVTIFV